jgi:hypothetical protein
MGCTATTHAINMSDMNATDTTFEVEAVYFIPGRSDTYVAGKIKSGTVCVGMHALVLVDGGLSMYAPIKSIGTVRTVDSRSGVVALALDTPTEEVRDAWKALCRSGDLIKIEEAKRS